jgi:hypothetical protein
MIEAAVVTRLKATAAVTALVGDRIYPHEARPHTPRPYIVYYGQTTPEHHLLGDPVGLSQCELTLEVHADGKTMYRDGKAIVTAIAGALFGFQGNVVVSEGGSTVETIDIRTCVQESDADVLVPPIDGSERGRYVQFLSYSIGFKAASQQGA